MAPVLTDSPVALVHGPFNGYGGNTRVEVNGAPQSVLTENPHECYFVPHGVKAGINKVTVTEGPKTASFDVFVPKLDIEADRTILEPSQSTGFLVRVSKLDDMPASAWKAGTPSESYNMDRIASIEPRFAPPAGGEGELLLIITDNTPQIATMNGAQGDRLVIPIKRTDLVNGTKEYRGTLTGVEKGTFNLDAVVVPLVAEVPGSLAETANPIAGGKGKPDCCQYWNPVVGNTCDDIVNSASCLEKIGGAYYKNSTCQDNGKCSLY